MSGVGKKSNWLLLEFGSVENASWRCWNKMFFLLRDLHFMLFEKKKSIDLKLGQFNLVACSLYVSIIHSRLCGEVSWWGD